MKKEKVVVNDTNVFIDLYSIGLLDEFFSLPWEVHTTALVMLELERKSRHPRLDDLLEVMRRWEDVRAKGRDSPLSSART